MRNYFSHKNSNIKGLLFLLGLFVISAGLWYTHGLVEQLKEKSTEYVKFRIKVFEANINSPQSNIDIGFFFNEVISGSDYPIVYTDSKFHPQSWKNINAAIDSSRILSPKDSSIIYDALKEISAENPPIPIKYQGIVLGYYFYGYPPEVHRLKNLPYVAILVAFVFVMIAYLGFTYIKSSEQKSIWVGMAKETAHQLGTPLSSLAGWIELLKTDASNFNLGLEEMGNDLTRLNKIANRFSKIGSQPKLNRINLAPILSTVVAYFNKRLPHINKRITIEYIGSTVPDVWLNVDLFEWVVENIIKNAIDSFENKSGKITLNILNLNKNQVFLDIHDNGKGIPSTDKKRIFKPGYSTKKRGWGLGLSLSKRIIEEYHDGRLLLFDSRVGQGSTFRIILKI